MKRALLTLTLVLSSACSVLFDPGKVPTPPACGEAVAPEDFGARAGDAPGRLVWQWTARSAGAHRLCTSVLGGAESCEIVQCAAGSCEATDDGLVSNVRVTGTLSAVNECDGGLVGSLSTGASAIDTSQSNTGWVIENVNCTRIDAVANAGFISVDQTSSGLLTPCISAFVTGDEGWGDLTLDAEVRHSASLPGLTAGVAIAHNSTTHRIGFVSQQDGAFVFPSNISKRSMATNDAFVAEGVDTSLTDWQQVRIIRRGKTVSWSQVPLGQPLVERLRWFDEEAQTGRFGLGCAGTGRFELRALRVTSRALPFPDSPDAVTYFPGEDGGLSRARVTGPAPMTAACPSLAACAAPNCAPPNGARCAQATIGFGATQFGFQGPAGLDPARDWEVTVRFGLPMNAALGNNTVLSVRGQALIESSRLQTTFAGTALDGGLADGAWHLATVVFPADGGVLRGTLDGAPVSGTARWPGADKNRGIDSLRLGGAATVPLLFHELSVRQP